MPWVGVRKSLGIVFSLVGLALACAAPAVAQLRSEPPLSDAEGGLALDTNGYRVWLPAPNWLDAAEQASGNMRPLVDATFRATEKNALLEMYPKGEGEALWTTLYGVRLSTGTQFALTDYREAVVSGFARNCRREQTGFFQLGPDEGDQLAPLGFVCGAYDERLSLYAGLGEVTVMSFRKEGDTVALVFQQWRGKAFDPADPAAWPVPTAVVEARARQLQTEPRLTRAD